MVSAFSKDSRSLVSANGDGSMMSWGVDSGKLNATIVSVPLATTGWSQLRTVSSMAPMRHGSSGLWPFRSEHVQSCSGGIFLQRVYYPACFQTCLPERTQNRRGHRNERRRQPQYGLPLGESPPTLVNARCG